MSKPFQSSNVVWHESKVETNDRAKILKHSGLTVWMTGLSASGKSSLGVEVEKELNQLGILTYVLDGDNLRHGLTSDLGFDEASRHENVRRVGEVASLLNDAGVVTIVTLVSPYEEDRLLVRSVHEKKNQKFILVWVSTPLEICETRDPKNLYKRARLGVVENFTGVSDPYEEPGKYDLKFELNEAREFQSAKEVLVGMVRERI